MTSFLFLILLLGEAIQFWKSLGFDVDLYKPISHQDFNRRPWKLTNCHYNEIICQYSSKDSLQLPLSDALVKYLKGRPEQTPLELDVVFTDKDLAVAFGIHV